MTILTFQINNGSSVWAIVRDIQSFSRIDSKVDCKSEDIADAREMENTGCELRRRKRFSVVR